MNFVTRKKLITLFRYLQKQSMVEIQTIFQTSGNLYNQRVVTGKIEDFLIESIGVDSLQPLEFSIHLTIKQNDDIQRVELFIPCDARFTDFGKIEWFNGGPSCYFLAKVIKK